MLEEKNKQNEIELIEIKKKFIDTFYLSSLSEMYEYIKQIGKGGQGSCFLVKDKKDGTFWAIK